MPRFPPRVLRFRTIITHSTPTQRRTTEELTFYNDGDSDIDYVVLHGYKYRPGMTIDDQDGSNLGFFPNEIVKDLLKQSGDVGDKKLLGEIERREKYILWITLPKVTPLRPGETRVIKISYTDAINPARPFGSLSRALFNIPEFKVEKDTPPSEPFPSNITIVAPEGFRIGPEKVEAQLVQEKSSRDLSPSDRYHITTSDSIVDVSLPHVQDGTVRFRLTYGIYPERSEQRVLEVFVLALLGISISLLALEMARLLEVGPLLGISFTVGVAFNGLVRTLLTSLPGTVVLVSLAFIGLTSNPLTHRTKYWTAMSLGLSVLTIVLIAT